MEIQNTENRNHPDTGTKNPVVSGGNIVSHTEEALQEKRLTIAALITKMNAGAVVGDIVDEQEELRRKAIEEQKDLIRKEQDEKEARYRQEMERNRLAGEAAAAENRKQGKLQKEDAEGEDTGKNLASVIAELSRKTRTKLSRAGFTRKLFQKETGTGGAGAAEDTATEDIPETRGKPERRKKGISGRGHGRKGNTLPEGIPSDTEGFPDIPEIRAPGTGRKKAGKTRNTARTPARKKGGDKICRDITITFAEDTEYRKDTECSGEEITGAYGEISPAPEMPEPAPAVSPEPVLPERENPRRAALQEEVSRFHEPVSEDEVYRFRSALERLSADSYCSVSVYAVCIIDREFRSLSIIKNVSLLAELIEESGDSLDFYFAYIITNKGVQHYGSDEAISDVSLAMEAIRTLFIQKKGRVGVEQIQGIPSLQIFQTIYYEDSPRAMRR